MSEIVKVTPAVAEIAIGRGEPVRIVSFSELSMVPETESPSGFSRRSLSNTEITEAHAALRDLPFRFEKSGSNGEPSTAPIAAEATIYTYKDPDSNGGNRYNLMLKFADERRPWVDSGSFNIPEIGSHIMKYVPRVPTTIAGRPISTGSLIFPHQ